MATGMLRSLGAPLDPLTIEGLETSFRDDTIWCGCRAALPWGGLGAVNAAWRPAVAAAARGGRVELALVAP